MSSPDAFRRGLNSGGDQDDPDDDQNGSAPIDGGTIAHVVMTALKKFRSDPDQQAGLLSLLANIVANEHAAVNGQTNGQTNGGQTNGQSNGNDNGGNGNQRNSRLTGTYDNRRQAGDRRMAADAMDVVRAIDRAGFLTRFPEARHIQVGNYSGYIDGRFRR